MPAFHQAFFAHSGALRVVLNLGGIANISVLPGQADGVYGFDTGPANTLLDGWYRRHHPKGAGYDAGGQWAASGQLIPALLEQLLAHPYFTAPTPRAPGGRCSPSTGSMASWPATPMPRRMCNAPCRRSPATASPASCPYWLMRRAGPSCMSAAAAPQRPAAGGTGQPAARLAHRQHGRAGDRPRLDGGRGVCLAGAALYSPSTRQPAGCHRCQPPGDTGCPLSCLSQACPKALPEQGGQPALPYAGASRPTVLGALYPA